MENKSTKGLWFILDFLVYVVPVISGLAFVAIVNKLVDIYNG